MAACSLILIMLNQYRVPSHLKNRLFNLSFYRNLPSADTGSPAPCLMCYLSPVPWTCPLNPMHAWLTAHLICLHGLPLRRAPGTWPSLAEGPSAVSSSFTKCMLPLQSPQRLLLKNVTACRGSCPEFNIVPVYQILKPLQVKGKSKDWQYMI